MYQERPTGVTIIAILFFIAGALAILGGLYTLATPVPSFFPILTSYQITVSIVSIVIGGLDIAIGWALWTLQEWGRIGSIVVLALSAISYLFAGVGLLAGVNIAGYTLSMPGPGIVALLIAGLEAWAIWYLLEPTVEGAFQSDMGGYVQPTMPEPSPPPVEAPPPQPTKPESTPPRQTATPQAPASPASPPRQKTEPIGAPVSPEGWLVLRNGPRSGQQFGLKRGRNTIGRNPSQADIVLEDDTVSGEHARIQLEEGQFYIYDLASTNGTFVNNHHIQKEMLMDNDIIRLGNAEMIFKRVN